MTRPMKSQTPMMKHHADSHSPLAEKAQRRRRATQHSYPREHARAMSIRHLLAGSVRAPSATGGDTSTTLWKSAKGASGSAGNSV